MLYIVTKKNPNVLVDVEQYFDTIVKQHTFDDVTYKKIIKAIDNSVYDYKTNSVKTPFGTTNIDNVSTGCKAVMLMYLLRNENVFVSMVECGDNAIQVAYELSKQYDLKSYMCYGCYFGDAHSKCVIDDKMVEGKNNIYAVLKGDVA